MIRGKYFLGIRNKAIELLLNNLIRKLKKGQDPGLVDDIYNLIDKDMGAFKSYLSEYVEKHPWEDIEILFKHIILNGLAHVLPFDKIPVFVFIDLEVWPQTKEIWDLSCLRLPGLISEDISWNGLVNNSNGFPMSKLKGDESPKSAVSRYKLKDELQPIISEGSNVILVGHNIRNHDVPILSEYISGIQSIPILDTLELSLLLRPLLSDHSLDGIHRAREDVLANLDLFYEFDQQLLKLDERTFQYYWNIADEEPGIGHYFRFIALRRGSKKSINTTSASEIMDEHKSKDYYGRSVNETDVNIDNFVEGITGRLKADVVEALDLNQALSPGDLLKLINSIANSTPKEKEIRVVIPSSYTAYLEENLESIGENIELLHSRAILTNRKTLIEAINNKSTLIRLTPIERLLLFSWLRFQGDLVKLHQLHKFVFNSEGIKRLATILFLSSDNKNNLKKILGKGLTRKTLVCDYPTWLTYDAHNKQPEKILLKAQLLDDELERCALLSCEASELLALCNGYENLQAHLVALEKLLEGFAKERYLGADEDSADYISLKLTETDANDEKLQQCISLLDSMFVDSNEIEDETLKSILIDKLSQAKTVIEKSEAGYIDIILVKDQEGEKNWLLKRVPAKPDQVVENWAEVTGSIIMSEKCLRIDNGNFLKRIFRVTPKLVNWPYNSDKVLQVDNGSIPPTLHALRPYMKKIFQWLTWLIDDNKSSNFFFASGSQVRAQLLSYIAIKHNKPIFLWSTYGSSKKTAKRISENEGSAVVVDYYRRDRRAWMPENTLMAILEKIPFPSINDPIHSHKMSQLYGVEEAFTSYFLPVTAMRLVEEVAKTSEASESIILADPRLVNRIFYRALFIRILGAINETNLEDYSLKEDHNLLEVIDDGLKILRVKQQTDYREIDLEPYLQLLTGHTTFHHNQDKMIKQVLSGKDILSVMPTGSGKSVCFQIPALIFGQGEGSLTVVISPLQSLMRDQVKNLQNKSIIGVNYIDSTLSPIQRSKRINEIRSGFTWLLYIAPEQLRSKVIRQTLFERGVKMLVVDEAHCISQWGHSFRPDYNVIPDFVDELEQIGHKRPIIAAFTATAPPWVIKDICKTLKMKKDNVFKQSPVRKNLSLTNISFEGEKEEVEQKKISAIIDVLKRKPKHCGIIYVATRKKAEEIVSWLDDSVLPEGWSKEVIDYYHGGRNNRSEIEQRFINSYKQKGLRLLVATNALGMGLDKPDIDFIIHYNIPGSLENYYQEVGRAARDPRISGECILFYHPDDLDVQEFFNKTISEKEIKLIGKGLMEECNKNLNKLIVNIEEWAKKYGLSESDFRVSLFELEKAGVLKIGCFTAKIINLCINPEAERQYLSPLQNEILKRLSEHYEYFPVDPIDLTNEISRNSPDLGSIQYDEVTKEIRSLGSQAVNVLMLAPDYSIKLFHEEKKASAILKSKVKIYEEIWRYLVDRSKINTGRFMFFSAIDISKYAFDIKTEPKVIHEAIELFEKCQLITTRSKAIEYKIRIIHDDYSVINNYLNEVKDLCHYLYQIRDEKGLVDLNLHSLSKIKSPDLAINVLEDMGILGCTKNNSSGGLEIEINDPSIQNLKNIDKAGCSVYRVQARKRLSLMRQYAENCATDKECRDYIERYFEGQIASEDDVDDLEGLLDSLNQGQYEAATAPSNNLLINAAAGTGKTQTIAARIIYLQAYYGIQNDRILALTFSKAGKKQIQERMKKITSNGFRGYGSVIILTIHGMAYRILTSAIGLENCWLKNNFRVVGEKNYRKRDGYNIKVNELLLDKYHVIFKDINDGVKKDDRLQYYSQAFDVLRNGHPSFSVIKDPEEVDRTKEIAVEGKFGEPFILRGEDVYLTFKRYYEILKSMNKIDYAGMLTECIKILVANRNFLDRYQVGYDYILVDEYQDTAKSQEMLVRLIAGNGINLNVVGDNDQTIFSFNGSDVTNIMEFVQRNKENEMGETRVVYLEENYRSSPKILDLANGIIKNNKNRMKKQLKPSKVMPPEPRAQYRETNHDVKLVEISKFHEAAKQVARRINLILNDEEVKPDEIAVLVRKDSITYPQGSATKEALEELGVPVDDLGETIKDVKRIKNIVRDICEKRNQETIEDLLVEPFAQESKDLSNSDKDKVISAIKEYKKEGLLTTLDILNSLDEEQIQQNLNNEVDTTREGIKIRTIHSSKGEEYRVVFLLYLCNKHFPDFRAAKFNEEEERRLLYVAITRAEERLFIYGTESEASVDFFEEVSKQDVVAEEPLPYDAAGETGDNVVGTTGIETYPKELVAKGESNKTSNKKSKDAKRISRRTANKAKNIVKKISEIDEFEEYEDDDDDYY